MAPTKINFKKFEKGDSITITVSNHGKKETMSGEIFDISQTAKNLILKNGDTGYKCSFSEIKSITLSQKSKFACFKMAIAHFFMFNKAPKRVSRREYWSFILYSFLFAILFGVLSVAIIHSIIPWFIFCGAFYIIFFNLTIKRFHDVGFQGYIVYLLIAGILLWIYRMYQFTTLTTLEEVQAFITRNAPFIQTLNLLMLIQLVITILPGSKDKNKFGEKPRI